MDFILKLVVLMVSFYLVQPGGTIQVMKSIKLNEKIIYDCVDIYKQPSLNHPLLQNHKIQMKPSFSISKLKRKFESKMYKKIIECPNGTVPILRNTKEYVKNAQYFAKNHFNPLTTESHGTHFAGVRLEGRDFYEGISSSLSAHYLNISRGQISYAHIYVGNRVNNKDNFIQIGWMINPTLYGDGGTWSYAFWKGVNGVRCYNTICPGFVQVSKSHSLSEPLPAAPVKYRNLGLIIEQDPGTSNWWITNVMYKTPYEAIGYFPKELFDLLYPGVKILGVGGAVESSPSGVSPPMGNGHRPTGEDMAAARVKNMLIRDGSGFTFKNVDKSKLKNILDSEKCYGLKKGKHQLFTYGGPGGNNCGV